MSILSNNPTPRELVNKVKEIDSGIDIDKIYEISAIQQPSGFLSKNSQGEWTLLPIQAQTFGTINISKIAWSGNTYTHIMNLLDSDIIEFSLVTNGDLLPFISSEQVPHRY